jgi:hypothetical protein
MQSFRQPLSIAINTVVPSYVALNPKFSNVVISNRSFNSMFMCWSPFETWVFCLSKSTAHSCNSTPKHKCQTFFERQFQPHEWISKAVMYNWYSIVAACRQCEQIEPLGQ